MSGQPKALGRPRSDRARQAVLEAADDLLVEVGYAALTIKAIAERAGVGRQTVYRWWATKAEILYEASAADIADELSLQLSGQTVDDLSAYVEALGHFLTRSPAGIAWRALIAAAQHDRDVAQLITAHDPLQASARALLTEITGAHGTELDQVAAQLVGPILFWVLTGRDQDTFHARSLASTISRQLKESATRHPSHAARSQPGNTASEQTPLEGASDQPIIYL